MCLFHNHQLQIVLRNFLHHLFFVLSTPDQDLDIQGFKLQPFLMYLCDEKLFQLNHPFLDEHEETN